jgi:hypothetical protein
MSATVTPSGLVAALGVDDGAGVVRVLLGVGAGDVGSAVGPGAVLARPGGRPAVDGAPMSSTGGPEVPGTATAGAVLELVNGPGGAVVVETAGGGAEASGRVDGSRAMYPATSQTGAASSHQPTPCACAADSTRLSGG